MNEKVIIKAAPFGMDLVLSIFYLAAPLALIELKANPVELGLSGTITSSVHMGMANFLGPLSDRLGRRRLIITAPVIFSGSCLLMTMAGQVKVILVLSALNGLGLALFWPSFQAWIADLQTGSNLARDIGSFNMSWTAAHIVGPIFSGFLYSLHPRLPFFVAAAVSLTLFLLTYAFVRDRKLPPGEKGEPKESEVSHWHKNFLYAIWVANFVSWFVIGNARYQFPKLARELAMSPHLIGLLISCIGLSQFFGFFILRRSDRWYFKRLYLMGAQVLAAIGTLLISLFSEQTLFALAFILIGLSSSVTYYSSLYYAVYLHEKKGRVTGMHESIVGSGALLGPILGGIVAHYASLRAPYLLCFAVLLMAIAAELNLMMRRGI